MQLIWIHILSYSWLTCLSKLAKVVIISDAPKADRTGHNNPELVFHQEIKS